MCSANTYLPLVWEYKHNRSERWVSGTQFLASAGSLVYPQPSISTGYETRTTRHLSPLRMCNEPVMTFRMDDFSEMPIPFYHV